MWSHTPRASHTSASSSSGSIAPVSVVPAVATTAIGVMPSRRSSSIARPSRSARMPRSGPSGIARRFREPIPSISIARVIE